MSRVSIDSLLFKLLLVAALFHPPLLLFETLYFIHLLFRFLNMGAWLVNLGSVGAFFFFFLVSCIKPTSASLLFDGARLHSGVQVEAFVTRGLTSQWILVSLRLESNFDIFFLLLRNFLGFLLVLGLSNRLLSQYVFNDLGGCCLILSAELAPLFLCKKFGFFRDRWYV